MWSPRPAASPFHPLPLRRRGASGLPSLTPPSSPQWLKQPGLPAPRLNDYSGPCARHRTAGCHHQHRRPFRRVRHLPHGLLPPHQPPASAGITMQEHGRGLSRTDHHRRLCRPQPRGRTVRQDASAGHCSAPLTDVTKGWAGVPAGALDLARTKAIEVKTKALVAACEKTPGMRCTVSRPSIGGLQYVLIGKPSS